MTAAVWMCDIKFVTDVTTKLLTKHFKVNLQYTLYIVVVSHATLKESLLERFDLRFSTFPAR